MFPLTLLMAPRLLSRPWAAKRLPVVPCVWTMRSRAPMMEVLVAAVVAVVVVAVAAVVSIAVVAEAAVVVAALTAEVVADAVADEVARPTAAASATSRARSRHSKHDGMTAMSVYACLPY